MEYSHLFLRKLTQVLLARETIKIAALHGSRYDYSPEGAIWIRSKSFRNWKLNGTGWSRQFLLYEVPCAADEEISAAGGEDVAI